MSLVDTLVIIGCIAGLIPLITAFLRDLPAVTRVAATFSSLAMLAYMLVIWNLNHLGPRENPLPWIQALVPLGIVTVLAGYMISSVIGREKQTEPLFLRPSFVGLAGIGVLALAYMGNESFLVNFVRTPQGGALNFGYLGKAYFSYLLVGIVLIGSNLESTYRVATGPVRKHLLIHFVTLFALLGFATFILASGLLYSFLPLSKLVALIVPLSLGCIAIGHGFLRGALVDTRVPVSRAVVYSSFTAVAAGLYLLAIGLVAQIAGVLHWSPNAIISISFIFFAAFLTLLLAVSRRIQRRIRHFIDRNFYVKKHDFQRQWNQVSEVLNPAQGEDKLLDSVVDLFQQVFYAREVTIALRERASGLIRPVRGKGSGNADATLNPEDPLCRKFLELQHSLLLDRNVDDFEYLPIYVEEQAWLDATASEAVAPLMVGDEILGMIGLERMREHDRFSTEDLDLMDNMSFEVATVLKGLHLTRELTETREVELLGQWSSMILHDLKNQLLPLQMLARNIKTHMNNPEFLREAVDDLTGLAAGTENLIQRLSRLRDDRHPHQDIVDMNQVVQRVVKELPSARSSGIEIKMDLEAKSLVPGDPAQLESVARNLVVNAVDAMEGNGKLEIRTRKQAARHNGWMVVLSVADSGPGMTAEFIQSRLFSPFATTKKKGLGLGLYQCRNIVRACGGEIIVDSKPGSGTRFEVTLKAAGDEDAAAVPLEVAM